LLLLLLLLLYLVMVLLLLLVVVLLAFLQVRGRLGRRRLPLTIHEEEDDQDDASMRGLPIGGWL
jgi:hypothetical protein